MAGNSSTSTLQSYRAVRCSENTLPTYQNLYLLVQTHVDSYNSSAL